MNDELKVILTNLQENQEEIDGDAVQLLNCKYKLFDNSFYLGSTASRTFNMQLNKNYVQDTTWKNVILQYDDEHKIAQVDIDKLDTSGKEVYSYELTDGLVNFEFKYDASAIFDSEGKTITGAILKNMCELAGVPLDTLEFDGDDIEVSWYDNRVTARTYLGMIAELNGGFARINKNGHLELVKFENANNNSYTINFDNCEDFTIGEYHKITRVVYDNGINKWEYGNETGNTLYLNTSNVFINSAETVEMIYNSIQDFEFYSITTTKCPIDEDVNAGDMIRFTDGTNYYPTIYQYDLEYFGGWSGSCSLNIETEKQQETRVLTEEERYNSLLIEQDRINAQVKIVSEQTQEIAENTSEQINNINQNIQNNYYTKAQSEELIINSASGLTNTFSEAGGNNVLRNTNFSANEVLETGQEYEYWYGSAVRNTNFQAINTFEITLNQGSFYQEQQIANGVYTLSFYYKANTFAECYLKINDGEEIALEEDDYTLYQTGLKDNDGNYITQPIVINDGVIKIEFYTDTDGGLTLYDIMLNNGSIKLAYSQNQNEVTTSAVNISKGITITANDSKTKFVAKNNSIAFKNIETDETTTEFTEKGTTTDEIVVKNQSTIVGILRKKVGDQVWDILI